MQQKVEVKNLDKEAGSKNIHDMFAEINKKFEPEDQEETLKQ